MKRYLLWPPFVLVAACSFVFVATTNAQEDAPATRPTAQHEVDDPSRTVDEYGLAVPVPISHPGRRYPAATSEIPSGPEVGERIPEFQLPNQRGEMIDFHESRADGKAVVVFYRSCVW